MLLDNNGSEADLGGSCAAAAANDSIKKVVNFLFVRCALIVSQNRTYYLKGVRLLKALDP